MARKTHKKSLQEYMEENGIGVGDPDDDEESVVAVSYTHLTLPTIYSV